MGLCTGNGGRNANKRETEEQHCGKKAPEEQQNQEQNFNKENPATDGEKSLQHYSYSVNNHLKSHHKI